MPRTDPRSDSVTLRPAVEGSDDEQVAEVYLAARHAAPMPAPVHTDAAIRFWISGRLQADSVWVAEAADRIVGYARFTQTWLDDLYVHPDHARQGVGTALLDVVKSQRPEGFRLWVFETNRPARSFYTHRGLLELEHTDGSANEEQAADLKMAWPGRDPLAFLRRLIDDVDDRLGDLLAERVALTTAVQRVKATSGIGTDRDPEREQEITRRLAERAPALGEDRLARIAHAIITESLDAGS